jgi:death on curing protein
VTRYLSLAEYFWLAEQVTGVDAPLLTKASRIDLADSALHAPAAGFEDEDFYPDLVDKAAVLTCRLAWNHPLPDGNKRAAWASLVLFLDLNGVVWEPDPPEVGDAEAAILAVAAGDVDEAWFAEWLRSRIRPSAGPLPRSSKPRRGTTLPEHDLGLIKAYCDDKSPDHIRDQVRIEATVRGRTVTILQHELFIDDWLDLMVARLKYDPEARNWSLYWPDRNSRFHRYEDLAPGSVDTLLDEIERDPTGIFWG